MDPSNNKEERLFRGYGGRILILITLGLLLLKTGQRLLPPLLPMIIDDLGITPFTAGIAISLMGFARGISQYPGGRFSDQLSRKTIILPGLVLGLFGFVLVISSATYSLFLIAVIMLGAGLGFYDPADRALVSDLFREKRGRAFGFHLIASDGAGILGAALAIIVAAEVWRLAFLPSIIVLVPVSVLFYFWSREPLEFSRVRLEIRESVARLFGNSRVRLILLIYIIIIFTGQGVTAFLPSFLIEVHDLPYEYASQMFAMLFAVGIVIRPLSGWLSDRMSRLIVVSGVIFVATISLGLLIVAPSRGAIIVAIIGFGIGQRGFSPPMTAYLMDEFPDTNKGGDLGAIRGLYTVFGSLGPTYTGFIVTRMNYAAAYSSLIVLFMVAIVVALLLVKSN